MDKNKKPIGIVELSRELGLPKHWLKEQALAGRIPCLHIGKLLRFDLSAVKVAVADMAERSRGEKEKRRIMLGAGS